MTVKCKKCNHELRPGDSFCSKCGTRVEILPSSPKTPQILTAKEVIAIFFQNKISLGLLYSMARKQLIPCVHLTSGRILFDAQELSDWWIKQQSGGDENAKTEAYANAADAK